MTVRYTSAALRQIDEILSYIRERSPRGALRIEDRIGRAARMIDGNPFAGVRTDRPSVRRVVLNPHPYALLYIVAESGPVVIEVRHTARR